MRPDARTWARSLLRAPDQLPHHLDLTIQSIRRRYQDPVKTLLALQALVPALLSRVRFHTAHKLTLMAHSPKHDNPAIRPLHRDGVSHRRHRQAGVNRDRLSFTETLEHTD